MDEHSDRDEVLFCEHHAAAQSLKSAWTRLASTYGCLMIALSRKTLTIKPHWFARWLINLLGLDLCHEIPVTNIREVTELGAWFKYGKVELHFRSTEGQDKRIILYLMKSREFVDKLANLIHTDK